MKPSFFLSFLGVATILAMVSCGGGSGGGGGKGQPDKESPSPAPDSQTADSATEDTDDGEGPQLVGPSNRGVEFKLAQVMRSGLPSGSPSNSVALFTLTALPKDPQVGDFRLVAGPTTIAGPGASVISEAQSASFEGALKVFSQDLSAASIEAIRTRAEPTANTIGLLVRMPRYLPGTDAKLNGDDFCDTKQRQLYLEFTSEPVGISGTARFEWIAQKTSAGLCELILDATATALVR